MGHLRSAEGRRFFCHSVSQKSPQDDSPTSQLQKIAISVRVNVAILHLEEVWIAEVWLHSVHSVMHCKGCLCVHMNRSVLHSLVAATLDGYNANSQAPGGSRVRVTLLRITQSEEGRLCNPLTLLQPIL